MATYNTSFIVNAADLAKILDQIIVAERNAAGESLVDIIGQDAALLPAGLRTVDGSYNHLLPGQEQVGAADELFPRLLTPEYRNDADGDSITLPGGGPTITRNNYDPTIVTPSGTHSVADADPRIISNLISDQTLNNQSALNAALLVAGSSNIAADTAAINAAFALVKAAIIVADVKQHTEHEYENAKASAAIVETQSAAATLALTNLLAGVNPGDPVDQADLDNAAAAAAAVDAAIAAQLDVVKALQSDVNVAPADLAGAQSLLGTLQNLKIAAVGIALDLADGTVDGYAAIQTAEGDATTSAGTATANLGTLTAAEAAAETVSSAADLDRNIKAASLEAIVTVAGLEISADGSITIEARSPDIGLSPANSAWMTFFGQFFDHGLDLVTKGGNGTIYMPLNVDDPLYDFGRDGVVSADDGFGADGILSTSDDSLNFMALSRATPFVDPVTGRVEAQNTTTPFVDQNQTYTSHSSHQVFLREYAFSVDSNDLDTVNDSFAVSTGRLLNGVNGGIANWGEVKAQAADKLGLILSDFDVHDVPLLATDAYGRFIPGANGFAQVSVTFQEMTVNPLYNPNPAAGPLFDPRQFVPTGAGITRLIEGTDTGLDLSNVPVPGDIVPGAIGNFIQVNVNHTGHAFLNDIARHAAPSQYDSNHDGRPDTNQTADTDPGVGDDHNVTTYDDEMLNAHFVTGDGRGNENIGLTAVHTIFHSEHNRLVEANKATILATGDKAFINQWLVADLGAGDPIPASPAGLVWDGERLFQAARFVTEMQYQHLVFEEFARRVQPNVDPFVFTNSADLNPAIVAEFAHAVYRFGHSQLTDTVDRLDNDLTNVNSNGAGDDADQIGLIEAFLNPQEFTASGIDDEAATGALIRGMSRQVGNEIDEFVVDALRNNLLGLPLDLPALNIARGREQGIPSLNDARAELYAMTGAVDVKPYTSWIDFAQHIKHPMSIVNFIAAYGKHAAITSAVTLDEKRAAATLLVLGDGSDLDGVTIGGQTYTDRKDFLNSTNGFTPESSGLNDIDMWIGGLAEEINEFGGMLGSTFNFVFEYQMEHLQNGDRFYYLSRTQGMNLLNLLEPNTFTDLIMRNTDLGDIHSTHLSAEIMEVPDMVLELDTLVHQENYSGNAALDHQDPADRSLLDAKWDDPFQQAIENKVERQLGTIRVDGANVPILDAEGQVIRDGGTLKFSGGEHVVLGGTEGNDTLIGDKGIDTLWGDAGNDYLNAGMESDQVYGGDGDDIIEDPFGDDFLRGEGGDDVIVADQGIDLLFGGEGQDFIMGVTDTKEVFAGPGNDFILGGSAPDGLMGNEGDDWIEGGEGFDGLSGENSELFFNSAIVGHDILNGQGNDTDYDGENGDDIMVQSAGIQRNNGMDGFDWGIHKGDQVAADSDLGIRVFDARPALILRDRFDSVEGLSGWKFDDKLTGAAKLLAGEGFNKTLTQAGVDRIHGLNAVIAELGAPNPLNDPNAIILDQARADAGGEIILGGAGSDTITGNLGDDIIEGDAWLNVRISVRAGKDASGPMGAEIATFDGLTSKITWTGSGLLPSWREVVNGHPTDLTKSLAELMRTGLVNPGQLQAVREILYDDKTTNGLATAEDVAVFSDVIANYTITRNGTTVTIAHTNPPVGGGGAALINDGIDTLRHIEIARFADGDLFIGNFAPTGAPGITGTANVLTADRTSIVDANGLPNAAGFTYQWQTSTSGTSGWTPVLGANGQNFTVPAGNLDFFRVVVSYTDGDGFQESVTSRITARVGTAGVDTLTGTIDPNLLNGLGAGDTLNGGDGDDVLNGGTGGDTLNGGIGDDTLNGGAGSDTMNGDAGLDTINYTTGEGPDTINGGADNDTLAILGTGGANTLTVAYNGTLITGIDGGSVTSVETVTADLLGSNNDTVSYAGSAAGVNVNLGTGVASGFVSLLNTENATGGSGIDSLTGTGGGNTLSGGAGNDNLDGGAGNDTLDGGADNDTLLGGANDDTLNGGAGDDTIDGGAGTNDTASYAGTAGGVTVSLSVAGPQVTGGAGTDTLTGIENLTGGTGGDTLTGNTAANAIDGGAGNDTLIATVDNVRDQFDGGGGNGDTADYSAYATGLTVTLNGGTNSTVTGSGNNAANSDQVQNIENFTGGSGNDDIAGDGNANVLAGGSGSDTFTQIGNAGGRDSVDGGTTGAGPIDTSSDTYVLNGNGNIRIYTRAAWVAEAVGAPAQALRNTQVAANTEIVITRNGGPTPANGNVIAELDNIEELQVNALNVTANNGNGILETNANVAVIGNFNTTSLNFSTITVNGADGNDSVDITGLTSDHRIVFNSGGGLDTIIGDLRPQDRSDVDDNIVGTAGDDRIEGGKGADHAWGNDGHDRFITMAGDGNDSYDGGAGSDTYDGSGLMSTVVVNLLAGTAGGADAGADQLDSIEHAWGGSGNDWMTGNQGNNSLRGNAGADHLNGYTGNDSLNGGAGDDTIIGGAGSDRLTGGAGSDKFVFAKGFGNDVIMDFDALAAGGQDTLDLSAMGITAANFANRVDIIDKGEDVLIRVDDSNTIKLKDVADVHSVTINDFVLFGG